MIVSQTFFALPSVGELGGLAELFSSSCGRLPLHSRSSLAKVDDFGRVSAFFYLLIIPPHPHNF